MAWDLLKEDKPRGELMAVSITGGATGRDQDGLDCVPKTELLMGAQRAFEVERLCVAPGIRHWPKLEAELLAMRRVPTVRGIQWVTDSKGSGGAG